MSILQRSRSFLYMALGSTVAQMVGLSRVRFYENGIVSFNLPPSPQVIGARATRTTHPRVIDGFGGIISTLAGKQFVVENPFLWKTKTDIVRTIAEAGCAEMNQVHHQLHTHIGNDQTAHTLRNVFAVYRPQICRPVGLAWRNMIRRRPMALTCSLESVQPMIRVTVFRRKLTREPCWPHMLRRRPAYAR